MFLERSLNDPHHPTSSTFHCYPLPIHHPSPPRNFDHTPMELSTLPLKYGCRNGAKFNILKFYSYSTFIHSYSTFVFVFSINICSKFNTYIYIQQFYLFTKLLSIQKLFIHSTTFYSFKIYCASLLRMEVTYFLQRMNRGQRRSASHHWNFEKIPTAFALDRLRRSEHLRLCLITLRRCSIDFLQNIFRELQTREK